MLRKLVNVVDVQASTELQVYLNLTSSLAYVSYNPAIHA
jgi:hypothetical protein